MLKGFLKYCNRINCLIAFFLISSAVFAGDYHFVVAADGTGDYRTVQEAINAVPDFRKTTFFAEYKNIGSEASLNQRVIWSHQLSDDEASVYTPENILGDWVSKYKIVHN